MAAKRLKRKPKKLLIILIIMTVVIIVATISYFTFFNKNEVKESKIISKIPKYGYTLKSNKSKKYKEMFKELDKILTADKVDEKAYAKIITKMFILDFYSLADHSAKIDVGGVDFVKESILDNFLINAEDTIYKYVESNIYKQREQKLPKVDTVTIKDAKIEEFAYGEELDEKAYKIIANWTYENETIAEGYQNEATLVFIHNDKKLELVELQ